MFHIGCVENKLGKVMHCVDNILPENEGNR